MVRAMPSSDRHNLQITSPMWHQEWRRSSQATSDSLINLSLFPAFRNWECCVIWGLSHSPSKISTRVVTYSISQIRQVSLYFSLLAENSRWRAVRTRLHPPPSIEIPGKSAKVIMERQR